ncbi:hypothetical protein J132_05016 [Termitomyces sp. J132]|nr:hypothetical protein J132_05016 [Termitomyces sp. J132]
MVLDALWEIDAILCPPNSHPGKQKKCHGYKAPKINLWSHHCLLEIKALLSFYTMENSPIQGKWNHASALAAQAQEKKPGHAQTLHKHAREYIVGQKVPFNKYSSWIRSKIDKDDELATDIKLHLQQCGKCVSAHQIIEYLNQPEVQSKHGIKKTIAESTAKWWMKKFGYQWVKNHKGQYVDGHECDDVVKYSGIVLKEICTPGQRIILKSASNSFLNGTQHVIAWIHNGSIFYAHDCQTAQWITQWKEECSKILNLNDLVSDQGEVAVIIGEKVNGELVVTGYTISDSGFKNQELRDVSPPLSSCTKDTVLTGLNYLKGQPPVLAAADEEYPEWLWTVLQPKVWPDDGPGGMAERVKRRKENKQRIKDRNFMSTQ